MPAFKDHFSAHAEGYARYRPGYPPPLFDHLAACCAVRDLAWDCGTGNGQAALGLARHFERVVATDASADQIAHAVPHDRVAYHVAPASASPLDDGAGDLVTVAQAIHWFDFDAFYAEVRRVLKPGGVVAVWTYGLQRVTPAVDAVLDVFYRDIVGPYWPPERSYVDDAYRTIPFPFDDEPAPDFVIEHQWTLADVRGYLGTWSASRRYLRAHGADPIVRVGDDLARAWGDPEAAHPVHWPVHLRIGRV